MASIALSHCSSLYTCNEDTVSPSLLLDTMISDVPLDRIDQAMHNDRVAGNDRSNAADSLIDMARGKDSKCKVKAIYGSPAPCSAIKLRSTVDKHSEFPTQT